MAPEIQKALDQGKDVAIFKFNLAGIIIAVLVLVFIWKVILPFISNLITKSITSSLQRQLELHQEMSKSNMEAILKLIDYQKQTTIEGITFSKKEDNNA